MNAWQVKSDSTLLSVAHTKDERPDIQAQSGLGGIFNWSGGCIAPINGDDHLIVWGGGHRAYAGNEIYACRILDGQWRRLTDASPIRGEDDEYTYEISFRTSYIDAAGVKFTPPPGKTIRTRKADGVSEIIQEISYQYFDNPPCPVSRHSYNDIVYVPAVNSIFMAGGSLYPSGHFSVDTWFFNLDSMQWKRMADMPRALAAGSTADDYVRRRVIQTHGDKINAFYYDYNKWLQIGRRRSKVGNYWAGAIDPGRKRYFIIGRGQAEYYDLTKYNLTKSVITEPVVVDITGDYRFLEAKYEGGGYPSMVWHDGLQKYVLWNGINVAWVIDPETFYSIPVRLEDQPALLSTDTGTYGRFNYSPQTDELVLYTNYRLPLSTLKLEMPVKAPKFPMFLTVGSGPLIRNANTGYTYDRLDVAIESLKDGDTLELAPWHYLREVGGVKASGVTIKSFGNAGYATLDSDGKVAADKAIIIFGPGARDLTIEGIEFLRAGATANDGGGIRPEGINLTIRRCRFALNQNGIQGGNKQSVIIIEDTEFYKNGWPDGRKHNIYINAKELHCIRVVSTDAIVGHNLKSRCPITTATDCVFGDGPEGTSSMAFDASNGGIVRITRCLLRQDAGTQNKHLIKYAAEGLEFTDNLLCIEDSMLVDNSGKGILINAVSESIEVIGNNFSGRTLCKTPQV